MKDSVMVLLETHECRMVLEALMLIRGNLDLHVWHEGEIDKTMRNIMLRVGLPYSKKLVPSAYAICYPDGPPTVSRDYGAKL